jgi:hypothetical protein
LMGRSLIRVVFNKKSTISKLLCYDLQVALKFDNNCHRNIQAASTSMQQM